MAEDSVRFSRTPWQVKPACIVSQHVTWLNVVTLQPIQKQTNSKGSASR